MLDNSNEASTRKVAELKAERSFLGHPRAVATLSWLDLCNAFSNYGMSSILVYYLYTQAPAGLGLNQTEAAQLVTLYFACATLCGLVGSYVADRVLGPRRAVGLSRIVATLGYVVLAVPALGVAGYALSQVLLCVAGMCCGRSVDTLTRKMYDAGDERCDAAFGIRYVINNVGAMVPALSGAIALAAGYSVAFAVGAAISAAGTVGYFLTQKSFFGPIGLEPDDPMPAKQVRGYVAKLAAAVLAILVLVAILLANDIVSISTFVTLASAIAVVVPVFFFARVIRSEKCSPAESRAVKYLIPLFICGSLTNVVFMQASGVLAIYAETSVDRHILGIEVSPATFTTFGAFFCIVFGSVFTAVWTNRSKQPSASAKLAFGSIIYSAAALLICVPFFLYPEGSVVSPLWLIGFWFLSMFGEAIAAPVGFSLAAKVAPAAFSTQLIMVWALQASVGSGLSAILANFYQKGTEGWYFLILGGVSVAVCGVVLALSNKIERGLGLAGDK